MSEDNAAAVVELSARLDALEETSDLAVVSGAWQFVNTAPPPTGNQIRMNNVDQTLATQIVIRLVDNDGQDRSLLFSQNITTIRIQDWDNSGVFHSYDVVGPAVVVPGVDATLTVTHKKGSGILPSQKVIAAFVIDVS